MCTCIWTYLIFNIYIYVYIYTHYTYSLYDIIKIPQQEHLVKILRLCGRPFSKPQRYKAICNAVFSLCAWCLLAGIGAWTAWTATGWCWCPEYPSGPTMLWVFFMGMCIYIIYIYNILIYIYIHTYKLTYYKLCNGDIYVSIDRYHIMGI